MFNIVSFVFGIVALILAIPGFVPFFGWLNYGVVPIALLGVLFGALSSSDSGRNFCLIVTGIAIIRLFLGGGFF